MNTHFFFRQAEMPNFKSLAFLGLLAFLLFNRPIFAQKLVPPPFFTDNRDQQIYQTITFDREIGFGVQIQQTWMAENLNYEINNSFCYQDSLTYCEQYGRLYTWEAAQEACPEGWHLPSDVEWQRLIHLFTKGGLTFDKGDKQAYQQLIRVSENSFSVLLGGGKDIDSTFNFLERYGSFWSYVKRNNALVSSYNFDSDFKKVNRYFLNKDNAFSIRCLKD